MTNLEKGPFSQQNGRSMQRQQAMQQNAQEAEMRKFALFLGVDKKWVKVIHSGPDNTERTSEGLLRMFTSSWVILTQANGRTKHIATGTIHYFEETKTLGTKDDPPGPIGEVAH